MSSRRGNSAKKGQRHQNAKAFKSDLHDTSKATKQINSLVVGGVCARCREIIEWRKKFKKYKPLTAPKKWLVDYFQKLINTCAMEVHRCTVTNIREHPN